MIDIRHFFSRKKRLNKSWASLLSAGIFLALGFIFFVTPVLSAEEENVSAVEESAKMTIESNVESESESEGVTSVSSLIKSQRPMAAPDVTASIIKVSGGLLLVIGAIFGSAWFFRRFGNFSPVAHDELRVIGGLTIGQKEKIVLLQVGEEQVLVGVSPGSIQRIHVLENPIPLNDAGEGKHNSFSDSLSEALGKWKNK